MGAIRAEGLRKAFGDVQALDGVSLDVPDGAFFVVLGPSGAGKTTTLRAIAGLEKLDAGSVHLDGLDATRAAPAARDLAMVFQSYALYPKKSVAQNIASPLRARRMPADEIRVAVDRVAELLHIERLLERKPGQLSGGEMQRVALARALVREPRAFLMDEPLTNLDLKLRVEMRTELTRIHRSLGRTFLYVTNDQVEALSMADRIAVLRAGAVQQVGAPREIYERPRQPLGGRIRGQPADQPAALPAAGRRAGGRARLDAAAAVLGGRASRGARCCSASAPRTSRSSGATSRRRSAASSMRSSRWATARSSTSIWAAPLIKVKARPSVTGTPGEPLRVAVDLTRAHLFDAETGDAIAR